LSFCVGRALRLSTSTLSKRYSVVRATHWIGRYTEQARPRGSRRETRPVPCQEGVHNVQLPANTCIIGTIVHDEYYSVLFSSFPSFHQPKFQDCERDAKTRLARLARPSQLLGGRVLAWTCAGSFLRLASFRNMLLIRLTVHPSSWRCSTANLPRSHRSPRHSKS
jgi:hypothetical protein